MPAHRIAYISTTSELGGAEISLTTLIRGLDRDRFDPVVALPVHGPLFERIAGLGVPVHIVPMETRRRRHPVAFWRTQRGLSRWIRDVRADLVHVNSFWGPEFAVPAAKNANRPVVYHCRDLYDRLDPARAAAFRQCDEIIAITQCVADALRAALAGLPVSVVYNDVDFAALQTAPTDNAMRAALGWEEAFVIGIASRLSPDKGQMDFIRAAGILAQSHPEARFLVLGSPLFTHDDDYPAALRREIDALGLTNRVHFTGFVQDVAGLYKAMDVCALASRSEPFGLVVVEAMACGTPVVATRSGGPQEILEDGVTGLLVDVGDPEQMAEAFTRLLEDRSLLSAIASAAPAAVQARFSRQEAQRIGEIYARLLERHASGDRIAAC